MKIENATSCSSARYTNGMDMRIRGLGPMTLQAVRWPGELKHLGLYGQAQAGLIHTKLQMYRDQNHSVSGTRPKHIGPIGVR